MGAGHRAHMRTEGPSHWGTIRVPVQQLSGYVPASTGKAVSVPLGSVPMASTAVTRETVAPALLGRDTGNTYRSATGRGKRQRVVWNSSSFIC